MQVSIKLNVRSAQKAKRLSGRIKMTCPTE
jgi:hypothetical protein